MKKQYFSIILFLAICIGAFGMISCKPKPQPGPSALASYVVLSDELIKGFANLAGYTDKNGNTYTAEDYAIWIDIIALYKSVSLPTNFNSKYWPVARIYPAGSRYESGLQYDFEYKEDTAGYYIIVKTGNNTVAQWTKTGATLEGQAIPTFGKYVCTEENVAPDVFSEREFCLCFDPSVM